MHEGASFQDDRSRPPKISPKEVCVSVQVQVDESGYWIPWIPFNGDKTPKQQLACHIASTLGISFFSTRLGGVWCPDSCEQR